MSKDNHDNGFFPAETKYVIAAVAAGASLVLIVIGAIAGWVLSLIVN